MSRIFPSCLLACLMAVTATLTAQPSLVPAFSDLDSLEGDNGWEPLEFPNIDRHSEYRLVTEDGRQVVEAVADNSASGMIYRVSVEPGDSLMLRWSWKVANVLEEGNARRKSGDDYPARIYVAFKFQPEKAGWFERAKRKAVSALFGEELPGKALNYIWANQLPVGAQVPNPFTEDTIMIAVNSGTDRLGEWVTVERDIVADYRSAFGDDPPRLVGVAIMTDADNTGGSARAWYGDISLTRP